MISIGKLYLRQMGDSGTYEFVGYLRTKDDMPDRKVLGVTFMANRLELDTRFPDELENAAEMTLEEICEKLRPNASPSNVRASTGELGMGEVADEVEQDDRSELLCPNISING